jgi:phosphotransferase system HPr (HPr) family protein
VIKKKIKIRLKNGLHARPCTKIVEKIQQLSLDEATMVYGSLQAPMNSIMSMLSMAVVPKASVQVRISGPDEKEAFEFVEQILKSDYLFPPQGGDHEREGC